MSTSLRIAVVGIATVLFTATIVFLGVRLGEDKSRSAFRRIERELAAINWAERPEAAADLIRDALPHARRQNDFLSLLRISWQLPDHNPDTLAAVAAGAAERHRDNKTFTYVHAYAVLLGGAEPFEPDTLPSGSDLGQSLRVLHYIDSPDALARQPFEWGRALGTVLERPDREAYAVLAERFQIPEVQENAALLHAAAGNSEAAGEILTQVRPRPPTSSPQRRRQLILARWIGDDDWADRILREMTGETVVQPIVMLLDADGRMRQRRWESAYPVYRELIESVPELARTPHLNAAFLEREVGISEKELSTLQNAAEIMPSDMTVAAALAGALVRFGRRDEALSVAESSLANEPDLRRKAADRLWLIAQWIRASNAPDERFESGMWRYLNDHPEADIVARYLAHYLFARRDTVGLRELRRRLTPLENADAWELAVYGYLAALDGDLPAADAAYADLNTGSSSWEDRYSSMVFALRHLSEQRLQERAALLESWLQTANISPEARSSILLVLAEARRVSGDVDNARRLTRQATEIDPDNHTAFTYRAILARP